MAVTILNAYRISATSSSSISQDSTANPSPSSIPPQSPTLPTKIILPNKKPQKWSTGVAPGDYGGPPTSTKLRKYWGGEKDDPLTSTDYIWNRDFMDRMKRLIQDPNEDIESPPKEEISGFLSLNRVMSLDSMDIDLSKQLASPSKSALQQQPVIESVQRRRPVSPKWKLAPTRREQEKWDRATKAATGGSDVILREGSKPRGDPVILAAESREQYSKLKNKLQLLTMGVGGVGLLSAYVSYSPEITASYGAGLIGSFVYIRMLSTSIDSMADGARGVIKGAIGQPRLLVPVALVMLYNRWNGIAVPNYGLMHLELIPMLIGFFTYKISTFIQAIEEAITIVENKT
ncbi:protein CONSERVED ONLY IN THE GREEN LINEAGE 160, chloroplastic [Impatiens glandulifera]|uniref:protein CONSERVED ONLY IN THE GREEN LINEAGE 160, chloroplastic n=1 Tax=Impatiens glandulifera TaxID=253017 RepID=UPI001FB09344|nr:protein CONSERVED ONLY IN THE GREEN LINEAGE 160, chloroplastic [Impatiens glandulifera]